MQLPLEREFLTNIAYDCVIFGFSGQKLKILIIRYHNTGLFALPGGFVPKNEDLDVAVKKGLMERTGLENIYLEQFQTFGSVERYNPEIMKMILQANGHEVDSGYWMLDRFISIAYYALINYEEVNPKPDALSDSIEWYSIDQLPLLMLDHQDIVNRALKVLRQNIERKLVGMNLLPKKFTMKELQHVFEAILGEELRRTTFQRRMLGLGILKRHEKKFSGKAHRAPFLYSFIVDQNNS